MHRRLITLECKGGLIFSLFFEHYLRLPSRLHEWRNDFVLTFNRTFVSEKDDWIENFGIFRYTKRLYGSSSWPMMFAISADVSWRIRLSRVCLTSGSISTIENSFPCTKFEEMKNRCKRTERQNDCNSNYQPHMAARSMYLSPHFPIQIRFPAIFPLFS